MEGNFLSRYNNKLEEWNHMIRDDPCNRKKYESEMSDYIIKCMPYLDQHIDDGGENSNTNNVFNVKETVGLKRKDIFTDYLIDVEKKNISRPCERIRERCETCPDSNLIHFHDTSDLVCDTCGVIIAKLLGEELTYREEQETSEKIVNYSYKRENHFNEWLSQFQAQEMTNIPIEVIDQLRAELKKMKIKNLEDITHTKIRGLLKKLRLNKYYEHVPYITNILNGIKPPNMPQELEEYLRIMFKDIQRPFDDNCPTERKNFLSYSYVLYKFCELLGEDEYLQYFPLLKSKEKLYQQDIIWKKICRDLHWEFIPTV
jgi:ribosomal protein S27E|tara:strand:+ start:2643 stop:3587 length:945 start_codon:yes stop_codon:yes gene_type:complete